MNDQNLVRAGNRVLMVNCTSCQRHLPSPDEICCWCGAVTETYTKDTSDRK